MKKGGYQILDLKSTSFTVGSSVEISGAYETIEGTDKAILVSGLVVGGKQYDDVFAEVDTNNSNYVINVYDYTLTIMSNDMVVVGAKQSIEINESRTFYIITDGQTKEINVGNGKGVDICGSFILYNDSKFEQITLCNINNKAYGIVRRVTALLEYNGEPFPELIFKPVSGQNGSIIVNYFDIKEN